MDTPTLCRLLFMDKAYPTYQTLGQNTGNAKKSPSIVHG